MKIILLNSDVDNFIINSIVLGTAFIFFLKWVKNKAIKAKFSIHSFKNEEIKDQLNNYTFCFDENMNSTKSFGLKTKMISILVSLIIVAIPLYELIETLRPQVFYIGWTCFPNYY